MVKCQLRSGGFLPGCQVPFHMKTFRLSVPTSLTLFLQFLSLISYNIGSISLIVLALFISQVEVHKQKWFADLKVSTLFSGTVRLMIPSSIKGFCPFLRST